MMATPLLNPPLEEQPLPLPERVSSLDDLNSLANKQIVHRRSALRALLDRSPVATLMVGLPDQRVRVANEAVAELIGSPRSKIVGLRPPQIWDGADGRRTQLAFSALTAGALDSF